MQLVARLALALCFVFACTLHTAVAQRDAEQIMADFSGQSSVKNLQATHRDLKSEVLLSSLGDGRANLLSSTTGAAASGFETIKRKLDPKEAVEDVLDLKLGLAESKYDKSKHLISKVLNLLNIPVGDDPLQDVLDAGIIATAATTVIAADLSQVTSSNLDRLLAGHKQLKDAYTQSKAETYKAILRNFLLIKQGFGAVSDEIDEIEGELCKPAEFTPPIRNDAEYRGPGLKLTFKTGACAVDLKNKFLDWNFNLTCYKPSITYNKTPPMFVSEHTTPATFTTRECKKEKFDFGEVEAVLHTFDGSGLVDPRVISNALFSNVFPTEPKLLRGSLVDFPTNNTVTDFFGSLLDWDLDVFDLRQKKPWTPFSFGSVKDLRGAGEDLTGLFTKRSTDIPDFLKKDSVLS